MTKVIDMGRPQPKQDEFLRKHARHRAFGGARGGGKSWVVRFTAIAYASKYPGIRECIVRRTYQELEENHTAKLRAMLYGVAKYNDQKKVFVFLNGSTIKMQYFKRPEDVQALQGIEYDVIFLDEATQLPEQMIRDIAASCRGVNDFPKEIIYTCNPGGPGHGFIKRLFIDREFRGDEKPEDYVFVQSFVQDNYVLMQHDPDYLKFLEALPERRREAWLYGKWDVYEGQAFDIRNDPAHYEDGLWTHVIKPFTPKPNWTYYRSFDWGFNAPFSLGYWCIDFDNNLYRILELYGTTGEPNVGVRMTADQVFAEAERIEHEHPYLRGRTIRGVADPAIWTPDYSGHSIAEHAMRHGIQFRPANNDRINGWAQLQYRLQFDQEGRTRLHVFNNCKDWIRTMPLMMYDEHKIEDIDTTLEDHCADETRYMVMEYEVLPVEAPAKKPRLIDPLAEDWD